ncbi:complement component 3-2 [Plakobranchus ocellatus]|uniref:Complement component 3-2 n=1 Tax=Plakobranchus ocellatus TaxID=259542 RepID=A0AAV3YJU0_9GAST|nr:complement component 3-2 [Plakobranchus ocellatus]
MSYTSDYFSTFPIPSSFRRRPDMACWIKLTLAAAFLLNSAPLVCGTKYLVTLPRKLQYDSEVVATVTAVDVPPGGDNVTLTYRGAKDRSWILYKTVLEFKRDGVEEWGVVFPQELKEDRVVFEVGNEEMEFDFDQDLGHIFIQTDKPIYSPRQAVKFRIIAVDNFQRLAKHRLKVDIKNPDDIIVDRMRYSAEEAFKGQQFNLPREATQGIWSISANFEVLPRFWATLEIGIDVITRDTDSIHFDVTGKYVYGRPVQGRVEIQLGVWDENDGVSLLRHRYSGEMKDGKYHAISQMNEVFPHEEVFPRGKRLYVSANVIESGTGESQIIVDTSTIISHPYYSVLFRHADEYFRPGFPYSLKADVSSMNGEPKAGVNLAVKYSIKNKHGTEIQGSEFYVKTNKNGRVQRTFYLPKETNKVNFEVTVLDWARNTYDKYTHRPKKLYSRSGEYIHISLISAIKSNRDGKIRLRYTRWNARNSKAKTTYITIQVLSKGRVVHTHSTEKKARGRSTVRLPKILYKQVSPSMRIVAYYHVQGEFVMDSLLVDTKDTCLEEVCQQIAELYILFIQIIRQPKGRVSLRKPGGLLGSPLPKAEYKMEIYGGPYMRVGLVAVDEAVFLLNDKQTLTRESFFEKMNSHDLGEGEGEGPDFSKVLYNSGLEHIVFDTKAIPVFFDIPPNSSDKKRNDQRISKGARKHARPQTVRNYFPESWLFEEITLPRNGSAILKNVYLPDSITTWNFKAVGLSQTRGICVSDPLRQEVEKLFFADVRLPYKVKRLEKVKVKIAIYNYKNYPLKISGNVSGSAGICFSDNSEEGKSQDNYVFNVTIPSKGIVSEVVKIIPLKNGDLTLRVELQNWRRGEKLDVVERKLLVVAEGLRVRKSITFVLDPEAKHVTYKDAHEQKITIKSSATVNNIFDVKKKEQNTTIDLALPEEVILGTDTCRISAFGDIMGDIITHAVVQSKSLVDQPMADAEEVLGDLGPTVHALLYVNQTGLATEELAEKGRKFVSHSVARLMKYREGAFFKLTPKSQPATWLTATVLKTLCFASKLTFVDKENLIDKGFTWLAAKFQFSDEGTIEELDGRLSNDTLESQVMLSAEVLIALLQCERFDFEDHVDLWTNLAMYLEGNIDRIREPMVLAKAAYAFTLYDPQSPFATQTVDSLWFKMRRNEQGQIYWSDEEVVEADSIPFWYQLGAKASAIEATSYALLVLLNVNSTVTAEADAIADWLVGQRNENGAFIGALDSMAAIQALSSYSLKKREQERLEIDLSCNISLEKSSTAYEHSFKFTQQDATSKKSVNNVPVGQKLEVLTKGQGLGQMHVDVEYNVPIDKNANCPFNISVETKHTKIPILQYTYSDPLCSYCNLNCGDDETETQIPFSMDNSGADPVGPPGPNSSVGNAGHGASRQHNQHARLLRSLPAASKRSICINVCLRYLKEGESGPTSVELEMLTGHRPVIPDVERIAHGEETCFAFRAIDDEEVGRPTPATVIVKEAGRPQPSCFHEYNPPPGEERLQVFCADISHSNRGECRCVSGFCSECLPVPSITNLNYDKLKKSVCNSDVVYELELNGKENKNHWSEIDATVVHRNKTGSHVISLGDTIKLITPSFCTCPHSIYSPELLTAHDMIYMLSPDVEKLVDRKGQALFRYLLDKKSQFLKVRADEIWTNKSSTFPLLYLHRALREGDTCSN